MFSLRQLTVFWIPLALMWLIMGIEQPAMSAVVTRLPRPEEGLAGFEVAFSIATLIHGPIVQMLSAGTAVVRGRRSYGELRRLLQKLVGSLTLVHGALALPPVFRFITENILHIPSTLTPVAQTVFLILIPLTALVGFRRFYQGALIQAGQTRVVSLTMVVRLGVTLAVLAVGLALPSIAPQWAQPGYVVAATAFVAGLLAGFLAARTMFVRRLLPALPETDEEEWSQRRLWKFYVPLALTSLIVMIARPLTAFAIARSDSPIASLAAWPLVQNYLFIFGAIGLSFQEVVIARFNSKKPDQNRSIWILGGLIAGVLLLVYLGVWLSGLADIWFGVVMAAPPALLPLLRVAIVVIIPVPVFALVQATLNGILVSRRTTVFITVATVANVLVQLAIAFSLPPLTALVGTVVAGCMMLGANISQTAVLTYGALANRPRLE